MIKKLILNNYFKNQYLLTGVFLLIVYMYFALLQTELDFIAGIGFFIIQPVLGVILVNFTIIICFLLGLPIRLNSKINLWWRKNYIIGIASFAIGLILIIISNFSQLQQLIIEDADGLIVEKYIPNITLAITGWFIIAFSLLHNYVPLNLKDIFKR